MDTFKTLVYLSYFLLLFGITCECCGRGSIKIQNNGYRGILIAISERVPEDELLIYKLKQAFVEASSLLYTATR